MSSSDPIYLDYNASAPLRPEAKDAVFEALGACGNASSIHAYGRRARATLEAARATVATACDRPGESVVFTSGATEANALALHSAAQAGCERILASDLEHDSILETARTLGVRVEALPVESDGRVSLEAMELLLRTGGRACVAVMAANNETGVLQPVDGAAALAIAAGAWLHVDSVQSFGRLDGPLFRPGVASVALSSHKLGGPQGVGALVLGEAAGPLAPIWRGGGQERGMRGGTENVAGVAGFAAAVSLASMVDPALVAGRRRAEARLAAAGAVIVGAQAPRLDNTLCLAVDDWPSALQVMALDLEGVMVSAGAACSSGKVRASRAIAAMGMGPLAGGALRASCGWASRPEDWDRFAEAWLAARDRAGLRPPAAA